MEKVFEAYLSVDVNRLVQDANKKYKGSIRKLLRDYDLTLDALWDSKLAQSQIYIVQTKKHGKLNHFLDDYDGKMVGKARGVSAFDADDDGFVYDIMANQISKNDSLLDKRAKDLVNINRNAQGELDYGGTRKGMAALKELLGNVNQPNTNTNVAGTVNPTTNKVSTGAAKNKTIDVSNQTPVVKNTKNTVGTKNDSYRDDVLKAVAPLLKSKVVFSIGRVAVDLVDSDDENTVLELSVDDKSVQVTVADKDLKKLPKDANKCNIWVAEQLHNHKDELFKGGLPDTVVININSKEVKDIWGKTKVVASLITPKSNIMDCLIYGGFPYYIEDFYGLDDDIFGGAIQETDARYFIPKDVNKNITMELTKYVNTMLESCLITPVEDKDVVKKSVRNKLASPTGLADIYMQVAKNLEDTYPALQDYQIDIQDVKVDSYGVMNYLEFSIIDENEECVDADELSTKMMRVLDNEYVIIERDVDDNGYNYIIVACKDPKTIATDAHSKLLECLMQSYTTKIHEGVKEFTDICGISTPTGKLGDAEYIKLKQNKAIKELIVDNVEGSVDKEDKEEEDKVIPVKRKVIE